MQRSIVSAIILAFVLQGAAALAAPADAAPTRPPAPPVTVALLTRPLPDTPGYHVIKATLEYQGKQVPLATGIFLPRAWYDRHGQLPLVVTLHNRGSSGSDGTSILYEGLALLLAGNHPDNRHTGELPPHPLTLHTDAQFVGLIPQCPSGFGWESPVMAQALDRLIDRICLAYHLDSDRVCLTGFSYGASCTWAVALQLPDRFSAIAPIAGRMTSDPPRDVLKLKDLAIYLAIGTDDHSIPGDTQRMHQALVDAGHNLLRFKPIPGGSHWSYSDIYLDPAFWDWMLSQRRGHHATTLPIVATTYPAYPPLPPVSTATPPKGHGILCQYWRDMPGSTVNELTSDPSFPKYPSEQRVLPTMEIPRNQSGAFGTCLSGWLCPAISGDYTLYLASDNQGQLLLSPDDQPQHLSVVARVAKWSWPNDWTQTPAQQSKPVHLQAGHRYFIQALQKDDGGDNHLSVAWKLPDGTLQGPIPADVLAPAAMVAVTGPRVVQTSPAQMPTEPGLHRVVLTVEFRARRQQVGALVLMPRHQSAASSAPTIVYCPDLQDRPTNDFHPATGPAAVLGGATLAEWSPFVVIVPQAPGDANWSTPTIARSMTAVVDYLLHQLPVDPARIYLTGANAGGTDVWRLASRLPGRFTAVAPINAMEYGGNLPVALNGTAVHIITGVKNGIATESANRMKLALGSLRPPPDVVYEMTMGDEIAKAYYTNRDFYQYLLGWTRPAGKPATRPAATDIN